MYKLNVKIIKAKKYMIPTEYYEQKQESKNHIFLFYWTKRK